MLEYVYMYIGTMTTGIVTNINDANLYVWVPGPSLLGVVPTCFPLGAHLESIESAS